MRKLIIVFICIVILTVTACSDKNASNQNTGSGSRGTDKIELTVGGVWISNILTIRRAAAEFNQNSETHIIQIKDYMDPGDDDLESALLRLQTELIAGGGPDIIFDNFRRLADHGPLLDLYPFIDADPELKREDFFPNMLQGMERPDGTLPMISNAFQYITTMITTTDIAMNLGKWTPAEFLKLAENNIDMLYPFGVHLTGLNFVYDILMLNSKDFINTETYEANIDSESFINLLEVAKRLSEPSDEIKTPNEFENNHDFIRMLKGEQLLSQNYIREPKDYQLLTEVFGDSLVTIGLPTDNGGEHFLSVQAMTGINANTKHADAAWEFLRMLLLPTATFDEFHQIPLRIDLYEALIDDLMTTRYEFDEDGNSIVVPHTLFGVKDYMIYSTSSIENAEGFIYELYAMPEDVAADLRKIVETAKVARSFFPAGLNMVIYEDLGAYFHGARTAEETARIMQNRIATYLSELQLVGQ